MKGQRARKGTEGLWTSELGLGGIFLPRGESPWLSVESRKGLHPPGLATPDGQRGRLWSYVLE